MKALIMIFTLICMVSPAYCQDGDLPISTLIGKCEEKFNISIAYNASELKDAFGKPIRVNIPYEKYRQKDLMAAIEKTIGGKFEKIIHNQWVLKPPKVVRAENINKLSNQLKIIDNEITELKRRLNRTENGVEQILKNR